MILEALKNTDNILRLRFTENDIVHVKYIVLQEFDVIHSDTFEVSSSGNIKTLFIEGKGEVTVIFLEINNTFSNKVAKIKVNQLVSEESKEPEVTQALDDIKNAFSGVDQEDPSLLFETFGRGMSKLFSMNNVSEKLNQIKIENSLPSTLKVQIRKKNEQR